MAEFCYILDYSRQRIYKIHLTEDETKDDEDQDILDKYGFKESECSWMYSSEDFDEIETVTEPI